jgi:plastocyanin domain-containing protein
MIFKKYFIFNFLISLGLLLGTVQIVYAYEKESKSTNQFRRLEQPLELKIGVTLGGLALIGAEVCWFLGKKPKVKQAEIKQGIQELTVIVDGGYEPNYLVVQANQLVRLNFLRKDNNSCLEEVLIPDFGIDAHLPLNQIKTVEFTPQKTGEYQFTCGMRMFRGVVKVEG